MNKRELKRCKVNVTKFVAESTDEEFDALVSEANKVGFRELTRKLMIAWVQLAEKRPSDRATNSKGNSHS